jgi:hypothetical protein
MRCGTCCSAALGDMHASGTAGSLEERLALLQSGTKDCSAAEGGCGLPAPIVRALERPPSVFTILLVHDIVYASAANAGVASTIKARARSMLCSEARLPGDQRLPSHADLHAPRRASRRR